jgi:flagellar basal body-associated protein FliL
MVTSIALPLPKLPYRGIEPFRYVDQCIFAIREEETWDLMSLITIYRGVLLYGESGTGKSSLIDAGLIPTAQTKGYIIDRLRVQPYAGGEIKVERVPATDNGEPPYLPSVFTDDEQAGEDGPPDHFTLSIDDFTARLMSFVKQPGGQGRGRGYPLLIFDQFEEIITLFDEVMRGERQDGPNSQAREEVRKQAPTVQARIVSTLLKLLRDDSLPVKILFVFREDYLAKLSTLFELYHDILDQYLYLQPPRAEELHEIIRAPFEKLPGHFPREIPEDLADDVAAELRKRSEGGAVNLTEVQIVCLRLWESPDPVHDFSSKGVRGLLQDYWEGELKKLPDDLSQSAMALLTHMLTGTNTRNIISGKELIDRVQAEEEGVSDEYKGKLVKALQALTLTKLVRRELRDNTYFYEIVSEFIVPRIVEQKVQREAELKVRKREKETRLQLERASEIEKLNLEREREVARQKQSRQRWVIIALVLFLLAVSATTLLFYQQRVTAREAQRQAEEARAKIDEEQRRSKEIYELLENLNSASSENRLRAIEQINTLAQANKLPPEVGSTLLLFVVTDKDPMVAKAASDLLAKAAENDPLLTQSIMTVAAIVDESAADKLPPRVSIQIETEEQRERAEQVKAVLERKGIIVPGIEVVGTDRTPVVTQLRHRDEDREKALTVIEILRSAGIKASRLSSKYVHRAGHLELWFGSDAPPEQGQWFVSIDFAPDTPSRRETVEQAVRQAVGQASGVNISFDGASARVGPLEKRRAERLKDDISEALRGQLLMRVSLQEVESN